MSFSRLHISVCLALAALVWGLVLVAQGTAIGWDHLRPFGIVVGFLVLLGIAFEHVLWRHHLLHGWFVKRPDLRGTWRVELQSDWVDPKTKKVVPLNICYMGVAQTLSSLQMHLMTKESESWFIAERIRPSPSGDGYEVVGVYTNKPDVHLRGGRSEMHMGALILSTHGPGARPLTLSGEYWTDRETKGSMSLSNRRPELATRFEDAARLHAPA